jgi:hypothetical protein
MDVRSMPDYTLIGISARLKVPPTTAALRALPHPLEGEQQPFGGGSMGLVKY